MQVKDITDEMVYEAIRQKNKYNDWQWEKRVPGYLHATSVERIQIAAMSLNDPKAPQSKDVWNFIPDVPIKVVLKKMEKMVDQRKLDYGVSLRTAWIVGEENA